jgi:hypothetical protein
MSGFFSKARSLASNVKVPSMSTLFAAKNKANTTALSNALKNYISSVRKVRNVNPYGVSHASLLNATKNNRAKVNSKLQNYIMNVNKAKYMNSVTNNALKNPTIPETKQAELANSAADANHKVVISSGIVVEAVNAHKTALKSIKNEDVNNNTKLNAKIRSLRNTYKNVNWSKVNLSNLTNSQMKVLIGLRSRGQGLLEQVRTPETPIINNRKNILTNLTNNNLSNNTKINAIIKQIREKKPNSNWSNVKSNGLSATQIRVLNGLKNKNYKGITRGKQTNNVNLNASTLFPGN